MSGNDEDSHGPLKGGLLKTYGGQHLIIGNITEKRINPPNGYISEMIHGDAPDEWE